MAKRGFQGAVLKVLGARDYSATVTGSELLAPNFLRVTFESDTLLDSIDNGPTAWVRLWIPDADGRDIEYQRGYTISTSDPETGTFSIDFVLHEPAGPASEWASEAVPGTTISLTSLGSTKFEAPETNPAGYLIIGDSAAIPAINSILEVVPHEVPIELYLEEHDPADREIPLAVHPHLTTHWVPRTDAQSLAAGIESRDWSGWKVWAAPESGSLKHLRRLLRDIFGFTKTDIVAQAYWIENRSMGKERIRDSDPSHVT